MYASAQKAARARTKDEDDNPATCTAVVTLSSDDAVTIQRWRAECERLLCVKSSVKSIQPPKCAAIRKPPPVADVKWCGAGGARSRSGGGWRIQRETGGSNVHYSYDAKRQCVDAERDGIRFELRYRYFCATDALGGGGVILDDQWFDGTPASVISTLLATLPATTLLQCGEHRIALVGRPWAPPHPPPQSSTTIPAAGKLQFGTRRTVSHS